MGFLLRTGFWFSLVLLALPIDVGSNGADGNAPGPIETFAAARQAIGDIAGLCDREPAACEIGRSAVHTVGLRAREAARIAYEVLDKQLEEKPGAGKSPPARTDAVAAVIEEARSPQAASTDAVTTGALPKPRP